VRCTPTHNRTGMRKVRTHQTECVDCPLECVWQTGPTFQGYGQLEAVMVAQGCSSHVLNIGHAYRNAAMTKVVEVEKRGKQMSTLKKYHIIYTVTCLGKLRLTTVGDPPR
jgi:hypothetical protein